MGVFLDWWGPASRESGCPSTLCLGPQNVGASPFSLFRTYSVLFSQLLQFNPVERLGAGVAGVEDIKSHPFFTPVDWAALTG